MIRVNLSVSEKFHYGKVMDVVKIVYIVKDEYGIDILT